MRLIFTILLTLLLFSCNSKKFHEYEESLFFNKLTHLGDNGNLPKVFQTIKIGTPIDKINVQLSDSPKPDKERFIWVSNSYFKKKIVKKIINRNSLTVYFLIIKNEKVSEIFSSDLHIQARDKKSKKIFNYE